MTYKMCKHCGQPMKPKGVKKLPYEYDHAQGCPYSKRKRLKSAADSHCERRYPSGSRNHTHETPKVSRVRV